MKKIVLNVLTLLLVSFFCFCKTADRSAVLLNRDGSPKKPLLSLLNMLHIAHDGTLKTIVEATQKEWLRGSRKERWEIPEQYEEKREEIISGLEQLNCVYKISAEKKQYRYAIVLGALASRVRSRLAFLIDQWNSGVRFDELIFLGGTRPLHTKLENKELLLDSHNKELPFKKDWKLEGPLPKTEYEMIKMIFDQSDLPDELKKNVVVTFIDTPMQKKSDGTLRRPNTEDTIGSWLSENPKPGTCLVISNQPYVGYQDSVVRTLLPKDFYIETIGCEAYHDLPIVVHLDNITRWLYQERKRRNKSYLV